MKSKKIVIQSLANALAFNTNDVIGELKKAGVNVPPPSKVTLTDLTAAVTKTLATNKNFADAMAAGMWNNKTLSADGFVTADTNVNIGGALQEKYDNGVILSQAARDEKANEEIEAATRALVENGSTNGMSTNVKIGILAGVLVAGIVVAIVATR